MTAAESPVRILFLVTELATYMARCIGELAALPDTTVGVVCVDPGRLAPYDLAEVTPQGVAVYRYRSLPSRRLALAVVSEFRPDVVVISGWQIPQYRYVARRIGKQTLRVLFMDNQWLATPKQLLGVATASVYVRPLFDVAFLPGERHAVFARKLGFPHHAIWRGMNSGDQPRFARAFHSRHGRPSEVGRSFLFVGRLVTEKGLHVLAEAYDLYRAGAALPWPLVICGQGPLEDLFEGRDGVKMVGFIQPEALPDVFAEAGCLVMPSVFEPWGVAIHEATAAGLPVICTDACGAAPHLVEDGVNGYVVESGSVRYLADAMVKVAALTTEARANMSSISNMLSIRYTPAHWAASVRSRSVEALTARRREEAPADRAHGHRR